MRGPALTLPLCALLLGCHTLDVSRPIAVVPDSTFGPGDREILKAAADCWNDEFGTDLRSEGAAEQEVRVGYLDFICAYAGGRTDATLPVRISICPPAYYWKKHYGSAPVDGLLFVIVLHELGHALNILDHAESPTAVMTPGGSLYPMEWPRAFESEDRAMFREANPDFVPRPSCASGHVVIRSAGNPPRCTCN